MLLAMSPIVNAQTTHTVCASGCDFTTIQAAINDAGTVNGDIIRILDAVHTESGINVTKDLTIEGLGASSTIVQAHATQGSATDRVFNDIVGSNSVTFSDMTIRHGNVTGRGGGIYNYDDTIVISDCIISDNTASTDGGGVYTDYYGSCSISNCTINSNTASTGTGGGFYNYRTMAYITNSNFNSNTAANEGGGIYNHYWGTITSFTNSTIGNNELTADNGNGGGLYNHGTISSFSNCTISGNSCKIDGGGIHNPGTIYSSSVTIANNECGNNGGGVYMHGGNLIIKNTIIGNNTHTTPAVTADDYYYISGTLTDNGYNLVEITNVGAGAGGFTDGTNSDIVGEQVNLNLSATLADNNTLNGTQTLALFSGSVAIDAGTDTGAPITDQRGFSRVGTTDIGAFEYGSPTPVQLSIFTAVYTNGSSLLEWTTQSESNNQGWNIYRSETELDEAVQVNGHLIAGAGTTTAPTDYEFYDEENLVVLNTYYYWLESVSFSGETVIHSPISLTIPEPGDNPDAPEIISNIANYPNPFSNSTTISFSVTQTSGFVTIDIYNLKGQMINSIPVTLKGDKASANWDGTDHNGNEVTSGIYTYIIKAGTEEYTGKMILTK